MQRIRWKIAAACLTLIPLFSLVAPLWAQGNVQATVSQLGSTSVWVIQFNWTADSGGNVPVTSAGNINPVQGYEITAVECVPGLPNPSNNYSVKVLDAAGVDVLAGAANAVSGTQAQTFAAAPATPNIQGSLRLQLTANTVAGGQGAVYVFVQKPGTVSARRLRSVGAGGGPTITPDWLTLANVPFADARRYNFAPQAPGGSLIAGSNTVTLNPVPYGVNGSDASHFLYVSGGTGTAEACQITGGGAVAGSATGTVTLQCANTHSGAWQLASASGGIQEAVCSLPAAGGHVGTTIPVTLYANVSNCGKTTPIVTKQSGATLAGAYTIINALPSGLPNGEERFGAPNDWTVNGIYDLYRVSVGSYPQAYEFAFGTMPVTQGIVAAMDIPSTAATGHSAAIAGYARSARVGASPVGVFGAGLMMADNTQSWGANFAVSNVETTKSWSVASGGSPRHSGGDLWGVEIDAGSYNPTPAQYIRGLEIVGSSDAAPVAWGKAISLRALGVNATPKIPWTYGLYSERTAATTGIWLDAKQDANPSDSQAIGITAYDSAGAAHTGILFTDQYGNFYLRTGATTNTNFYITDSAGTTLAVIGAAGKIAFPNLPSVAPAAGSKQLWYDTTDSNRVKYVP